MPAHKLNSQLDALLKLNPYRLAKNRIFSFWRNLSWEGDIWCDGCLRESNRILALQIPPYTNLRCPGGGANVKHGAFRHASQHA